jgi:hypothetical protein
MKPAYLVVPRFCRRNVKFDVPGVHYEFSDTCIGLPGYDKASGKPRILEERS